MVGGFRLGDDQQPAGVFIEAMDNARPPNSADSGQTRAAMADQGVDESAVGVSRRGMNNQTGRLVDDDEMCVLETNVERDRLRYRACLFRLGEDNYEILTAANAECRLAQRRPITCDLAGFDHSFEPCP